MNSPTASGEVDSSVAASSLVAGGLVAGGLVGWDASVVSPAGVSNSWRVLRQRGADAMFAPLSCVP